MKKLLAILLAVIVSFVTQRSYAQTELEPKLDRLAHQVFAEVMSPFCAGRLLQDCPSSEAAELKEKVRQMLKQGQTKEQVSNYLYSVYGQGIRAAPGQSGFGLVAWITPALFLLGGLAFLMIWLKAKSVMRSQPTAGSESDLELNSGKQLSSADKSRIEQELRQ